MRMHGRLCLLAAHGGHLSTRHPSDADASEVDRLEAGPRKANTPRTAKHPVATEYGEQRRAHERR